MSSAFLVWIFKVAVTPLLVALASLAARRWGPRIGGILIGFPVMTGPLSLVLAIEQGVDFAEGATIGILLALVAATFFCLAYAAASEWLGWAGSIATALLVFLLVGCALTQVNAGTIGAAALAFATILAGIGLVGRPDPGAPRGRIPRWDIWLRMTASGMLVVLITAAASQLGPLLSGIVGTFPVISTVVFTFTHHHWGRATLLALLRGMLLSLLAFASCFLVIGLMMRSHGLFVAYGLGALAAAATSVIVLALDRALAPASSALRP